MISDPTVAQGDSLVTDELIPFFFVGDRLGKLSFNCSRGLNTLIAGWGGILGSWIDAFFKEASSRVCMAAVPGLIYTEEVFLWLVRSPSPSTAVIEGGEKICFMATPCVLIKSSFLPVVLLWWSRSLFGSAPNTFFSYRNLKLFSASSTDLSSYCRV